ncbi:MAG: helix-turn-helix domain-containing protein [Phycisphaerales bacterium]|jgi:hypothetical protein|nr:helix-turn-helix domain-containing protein [Phycisphaerales bacterium]
MAKMFYTLGEVCEKLGKSEAEVEAMVASGQIQEFRDGESLVFKVEQIELLAGNDDSGELDLDLASSSLDLGDSFGLGESDSGAIGLAESQSADMPAPAGQEDSGSAIGLGASSMLSAGGIASDDLDLSAELESPAEGSDASASVSAFDGAAIDAGGTALGEGLDDDLTLESVGSGSGLLDLTRESDDTSLGAELLEEVYSSDDEEMEFPAASGLFEAATDDEGDAAPVAAVGGGGPSVAPAAAPAMVAAQSWDPTWSGLSAGLMVGGLVALIAVFAMVVVETMGGASGIAALIAEQMWIWVGGLAGGTLLLGVIGWVLGGKSG